MTRTEFLRVYGDWKRECRQKTAVPFSAKHEAEAHSADRNAAAALWRKQKNRLQNLTIEEWRKQENAS